MRVLLLILMLFCISDSRAQSSADARMLERATPYFGLMNEVINRYWPELPMRTFVPAQIEQESLWNPRAELCVPRPSCSRERGIGFGQFTITPRMNVFEEVKRMHPDLRDWSFADRYDPRLQLIAIVVKDKAHYRSCRPLMSNDWGGLACTAASYNGGFGGFTSDRRLCSNTKGCNPQVWTGNIEVTSLKAKVKVSGYGKSFFEINREYVGYVMRTRSPKYAPYMKVAP
jgi:hypothetical protein